MALVECSTSKPYILHASNAQKCTCTTLYVVAYISPSLTIIRSQVMKVVKQLLPQERELELEEIILFGLQNSIYGGGKEQNCVHVFCSTGQISTINSKINKHHWLIGRQMISLMGMYGLMRREVP